MKQKDKRDSNQNFIMIFIEGKWFKACCTLVSFLERICPLFKHAMLKLSLNT